MVLGNPGGTAPKQNKNGAAELDGKVFCLKAGDIFIIDNAVIDDTGITFPTVPPSKETLRQTHKEIGDKFEAYLGGEQKKAIQTAESDSFSSETLKKLRELREKEEGEPADPKYSAKDNDSLTVAFMKARQLPRDDEPKMTGAEALAQKINLDDILKGVSSNSELDESQKLLNRMAKQQNAVAAAADKNSSWAKSNLKQEALPYQIVRNRNKSEEEEPARPFVALNSAAKRNTGGEKREITALPKNYLQNPNDTESLQKQSSALIMNKLTHSPFRETVNAKKVGSETPHVIFSTQFTAPKPGSIPLVPNINDNAAKKTGPAAQPADGEGEPKPEPKIEGTIITNPALGGAFSAQSSPRLFFDPKRVQMNSLSGGKDAAAASGAESQTAAVAKQLIELNLNFGGRPADNQIPVYVPLLNNFYRHRLKKRIDSSSSPVKMSIKEESAADSSANIPGQFKRLQLASTFCAPAEEASPLINSFLSKRINAFAEISPLNKDPLQPDESPAYDFARINRPVLDFTGRLILALDNRAIDMHVKVSAAAPSSGLGSGLGTGLGRGLGGGLGKGLGKPAAPAAPAPPPPAPSAPAQKASSGLTSGAVVSRLTSAAGSAGETEVINCLSLLLKLNGGELAYKRQYRMASIALEIAAELKNADPRTKAFTEYGTMFRDVGEIDILLSSEAEELQNAVIEYIGSEEFRQSIKEGKGKFEVPEWLLMEKRNLEGSEYEQLKLHPQRSEEILSGFSSLRALASVVRSHHERWDGKGFPDGLSGERIPLAARIIAVCDAYDSLTKKRRVGRKYLPAEACTLIKAGSGSAFDPKCVEALINVVKSYNKT